MIKKILVANRGEIACRIIKTSRSMGIKTVAVYSDADANALHVRMADEAMHIGSSEAQESYLSIEKLINASKKSGADAVHPGYGFLSENPNLPTELAKEKIEFIGPPASAIKAMGDKITSKKIASDAGVPTIPGSLELVENVESAVSVAKTIGYPVMIKASAGGGGKGMRVAFDSSDVMQAFQSSQNEAKKSFGDDRIFIEKFIQDPRHIEIQVVGDKFGNFVHFGERECSIQRRNQKVIEEAPSPFLKDSVRQEMGRKAISLAKAVNYFSVGTVEFIVDSDQRFYFLEMNTRLQVEHPITELVYDVDLVKEMIKIASKETLSFSQEEIKVNGWAIESRIYAEDAERGFLPSSGRLALYSPPVEVKEALFKLRNDTGVYEGAEVPIFYDPMIAKLCVWATSRAKAISGMQEAMDNFLLDGVANNIDFLSAVIDTKKFKQGDFTTSFIEEEFKGVFTYIEPDKKLSESFGVIAICLDTITNSRFGEHGIDEAKSTDGGDEIVAMVGDKELIFNVRRNSQNTFTFISKKDLFVEIDWIPGKKIVNARLGDDMLRVKVRRNWDGYEFKYRGARSIVKVFGKRESELRRFMIKRSRSNDIKLVLSPMPGLLVKVAVSPGDNVISGQVICVVEAMKMENVIRAEKNSVVKDVNVIEGQSLAVGDVIVEFE